MDGAEIALLLVPPQRSSSPSAVEPSLKFFGGALAIVLASFSSLSPDDFQRWKNLK